MTTKMSAPASPVVAEDEKGNVKDKKTWLENVFNKKSPGESTASDSNPPTPSSPGLVEDRHKWIKETLLSKSDDVDFVKKVELLSDDLAVPSFGEDRSACEHTANSTKDEDRFESVKDTKYSVPSGHTGSIGSFVQSPEDATMTVAKNGEKEATISVVVRSAETQDASTVEGDPPNFRSATADEEVALDEPPFLNDEKEMNTVVDSHEHTVTHREEVTKSEMIDTHTLEQEKRTSDTGETDPDHVKLQEPLELGNDQHDMDHRQPVECVAKQSDEPLDERNGTAKREFSSPVRVPVEKVAIVSTVDETMEANLHVEHEKIEVEDSKPEEIVQSVETTLIAETSENLCNNAVPENDDQLEQTQDPVAVETEDMDSTSDNKNVDTTPQVDVVRSTGSLATTETVVNESVEVEVFGEALPLNCTPTVKVDDCPETYLDSTTQEDVVHSTGTFAATETAGNESVRAEAVGEGLQLDETPTLVDRKKVDDCPETCLDSVTQDYVVHSAGSLATAQTAGNDSVKSGVVGEGLQLDEAPTVVHCKKVDECRETCPDSSAKEDVVHSTETFAAADESERAEVVGEELQLDGTPTAVDHKSVDDCPPKTCPDSSDEPCMEVVETKLVDTKTESDESINNSSKEAIDESANKEDAQLSGKETQNPIGLPVTEDLVNSNEPALVSHQETAIDEVDADNGKAPLPTVEGTEERGNLDVEESEPVFVGNFETPHKDPVTKQLKKQDDDEETEVIPFVGEFETPHKSVRTDSAKSSTCDWSEETESVAAKSSEDILAQNTTEETVMISNQTVIETPYEYTMVGSLKVKDIATTFSSDSSSFSLAQLTPDVTIPVSPTSSNNSTRDELGVNQHRIDPSKFDFLHTRKGKAFVEHARRNAQRFREVKKSVVMSETWCGDATSIRQQTVLDSLTAEGDVTQDGPDSPENELTQSSTGQQGAIQEEDIGSAGCFETACTIT